MNYNDSYYLLVQNFESEVFQVVPTDETALRRFHYRQLELADAPVTFNAKKKQLLNDLITDKPLMLFCKPSFIVASELKTLVEDHIYGGQLYPAIIASKETSVEGYYLINMYQKLDCWDRETSEYQQKDPDYYPRVSRYQLDDTILDAIPENERLLFKMGGTDLSPVFVHEHLKNALEQHLQNVRFFRVSDYQFGDEF